MKIKTILKNFILKIKTFLNKHLWLKSLIVSIFKISPSFYKRIQKVKPTINFDSYRTKKIYHDIKHHLEEKN